MINSRKRQHEEYLTESLSKRRRHDDSPSLFDRLIDQVGGWFRKKFGRQERLVRSSTMYRRQHEIPSNNDIIVIDDDDDDDDVVHVTPPTYTSVHSTTVPDRTRTTAISNGSSNNSISTSSPLISGGFTVPMISPIMSTSYTGKLGFSRVRTPWVPSTTNGSSTVSTIDIARKKQDRIMFQKLIDNKVLEGERKLGTPPLNLSSQPIVKLYSVNDRPRTTSHYSSFLKGHQHVTKTPQTLSSRYQPTRDPSILLSSSSVISRQPCSLTSSIDRKQPESVPAKKLSSSYSSSPLSSSSLIKDVPVHFLASNTPSEFNQWFSSLKQRHEQTTSDYQAKVEVVKKYAKIHQEQRLKAEDTRAEKLATWMNNLKVRPWMPGIEESVDELTLILDEDTNQQVDDIWSSGRYSQQQVFAEGYNIKVKRCDLITLRGLEWLNDEVINFYLNLLTETVNNEGKKKVHLFNSFFYPKIMSAGYSGVRRWTKKVDIFSFDLILIPIHLGMHWCLAAIDFTKKQIGYFDSLKGNNPKCLTTLRDYLVSEAKDKKQMNYDVSDWLLECFQDIPEQYNGSDCGVFTCMYARHLARDKSFDFSQDDMSHIRRLMVAEIVNKKLL